MVNGMLISAPVREAFPPPQPVLRSGQVFHADQFPAAGFSPRDAWEQLCAIAVREQASDIHLTWQADGLRVALRLDGRLTPQGVLPAEYGQRLVNHVKVEGGMDLSEHRRPQDGHSTRTVDDRPVDLRLSLLPTNHGEDIAVRMLDREIGILGIEQLGVFGPQAASLLGLVQSPSGLVLVSGPTGAGKTTTLYALLNHLADGSRRIVTIENPIEFDLPGVSQSQVNHRIGVDWSSLMRTVLRHDPNVIMIGEIRDADTAAAVVRAANSGRLVLATSHAVHSGAALDSLIQLGANRHFLARALRGVVAQTLVRRLCPYCTIRLEETAADAHILDDVRHLLGPGERPALSMGRGCPHCRHTGYRGRLGVFEILSADDALRDRIAQGAPSREVYQLAVAQHMTTITQAGKLAALRGLTTIEELLSNVSEIWAGGN